MINTFVSRVLFPAIEAVERRHFRSILDWYLRCQYLPYEELKARQEEKMRQLVRHAYLNVPFFRDKFDAVGLKPEDIRTIEDLPRIPITTKLEIRQNFPGRVLAENIPSRRRTPGTTSGSTGEPLVFYRDRASQDYAFASFLLFNHWAGIRPGDTSVHIGMPDKFSIRTYVSNLLQRHSEISVCDLTPQNMEAMLQRLARMKAVLIRGHASAMFRLARAVIEHGVAITPKAVTLTADTLPSRELLERAFRCPVFNMYGNMEMGGSLAQNCPEGHSLHINPELCILEVVNSSGRCVKPGEKGKVVLTDLNNYVMPFIRYDSGDIAIAGGECPCNRGFPLVSSIEGRSIESLITPQGRLITPIGLGHYLFTLHDYTDYFLNYQAEQNEPDRVAFRFVPLRTVDDKVKRRLHHDLRELMGEGVEVNLEFVDDIPLEASGKQLIIKSSVADRTP